MSSTCIPKTPSLLGFEKEYCPIHGKAGGELTTRTGTIGKIDCLICRKEKIQQANELKEKSSQFFEILDRVENGGTIGYTTPVMNNHMISLLQENYKKMEQRIVKRLVEKVIRKQYARLQTKINQREPNSIMLEKLYLESLQRRLNERTSDTLEQDVIVEALKMLVKK